VPDLRGGGLYLPQIKERLMVRRLFYLAYGYLTGKWYSMAYKHPTCRTCGKTPENVGWCDQCGYNRNYL
jgi:hypothetical protein